MIRARWSVTLLPLFALLCLAATSPAADDGPSVVMAQGTIEKVTKDAVTIRPRNASGQFEKAVTLKITGTSRISTLTTRKSGGKQVLVQRDTEAKELKAKQTIAVIYASGATGPVLLAAVVQPAAK